MLPLDLHVLGLSLAFILSQDQTLRCKIIYNKKLILHSNDLFVVALDQPNLADSFLLELTRDICYTHIIYKV